MSVAADPVAVPPAEASPPAEVSPRAAPRSAGAPRAGLRACARLRAEAAYAGARTTLTELVSDGPLALRRTSHPEDPGAAQATVVGAMAAPLGGDHLRLTVHVGPFARLRVTSAAATVSLPGPLPPGASDPQPARYELDFQVAEGGVLEWLPEPVIAAAGSDLQQHTRVLLAPGARLALREEQVLGRTSDPQPGRLTSRLTVRRATGDGAGPVLLDQETALGPGAPGWDGPAVLGGYRALGQLLSTGPAAAAPAGAPAQADCDGAEFADLALPGDCGLTLRTAVARDGLGLRRALSAPPHRVLP